MIKTTIPNGLFITGTDTGVGKTHLTCLIARQLIGRGVRVAAYKPVCSGAIKDSTPSTTSDPTTNYHWEDIDRIKAAIGDAWPDHVICPQRFIAPLAPPIAARMEGKSVDFSLLVEGFRQFHDQDVVLIEGAGGWLSPVTETQTVADVARAIGVPVLIVARAGLGTINHTLLTIESVRARGLKVAGIVLNETVSLGEDISWLTNMEEIESRNGAPVFGIVHANTQELKRQGLTIEVNWQMLAGPASQTNECCVDA